MAMQRRTTERLHSPRLQAVAGSQQPGSTALACQGDDGPNGREDGHKGDHSAEGFVVAEPVRRKREVLPIHKAARAVLKVRRGWQVQDALAASGIPVATWYQWLKVSPEGWPDGTQATPEAQGFAARLRAAFTRAQALAAGKATESVYGAAKLAVGERDWRAGHEWLKHGATRARWHEHRELKIEHGGKVDHQHRLARALSDEELIEALPADWRELCEPAPLALPERG